MGLDSVRLNQEGAAPLQKGLEMINAVSESRSFTEMLATMH